jgi:hypothetical protein
MEKNRPPHLNDYATLGEWKHVRADYFANLPQRDRTPKVIRTVRTETVEVPVDRIVYVDREVVKTEYVDRIEEVEIPEFLRYNPLDAFIANEQADGETDEATLDRLRRELTNLFQLEKGGPLEPAEEARKRHLTSNIKAGD